VEAEEAMLLGKALLQTEGQMRSTLGHSRLALTQEAAQALEVALQAQPAVLLILLLMLIMALVVMEKLLTFRVDPRPL
jgi:hypothetical protein